MYIPLATYAVDGVGTTGRIGARRGGLHFQQSATGRDLTATAPGTPQS